MEDAERDTLTAIVGNIQDELTHGADDDERIRIIIGYITSLLHYCNRFYNRQFRSIRVNNGDILVRFGHLIDDYYESGSQHDSGLPTVQYFADKMCMSASYFSDMVRKTAGESAGSIIRNHIIRMAKNRLTAGDGVSQVAFHLGFNYPQHFTRMFKKHTGLTPKEYVAGKDAFA